MSWATTKAFNWRSTLAFVTDPTNTVHGNGQLFPNNYTIGGETVSAGWINENVGLGFADRDATAGREKLAGICYLDGVHPKFRRFCVTLPASGSYGIRLGLGDQAAARPVECEVLDDSTSKFTLTGLTTGGADQWIDANGNNHTSAANWYANNGQRVVTFSTTTFYLKVSTSASGAVHIAHLELEQITSVPILLLDHRPGDLRIT